MCGFRNGLKAKMPRRSFFSPAERATLLQPPQSEEEFARHYTFSETDLSLIRQRRGDANRLGFAVQLCLLRFPGRGLQTGMQISDVMIRWIGSQLGVEAQCWPQYASRGQTRREHLVELRAYLGLRPFQLGDFRRARIFLSEFALRTDKGTLVAIEGLREWRLLKVMIPPIEVVERLVSEAITRANRQICAVLADLLSEAQRAKLDGWLELKPGTRITWLSWLRQSPVKPNSRHMLEHIERLREFQSLGLPDGLDRRVHQNRLLKMAREGGQMTSRDLGKYESQRKYATLVALAIEGTATVIDQIIDLHDRIIGKLLNAARHKHQQRFQQSGRRINDQLLLYGKIGRALVKAKAEGVDAFAAIETVLPWDEFAASVAETGKLSQPEEFDFIHLLAENWPTVRRYAPALLEVLQLKAAPAGKAVLQAVEQIRALHAASAKELPADAPTAFIRKRWEKLVRRDQGLDRRNYELCALCELKTRSAPEMYGSKGRASSRILRTISFPLPRLES